MVQQVARGKGLAVRPCFSGSCSVSYSAPLCGAFLPQAAGKRLHTLPFVAAVHAVKWKGRQVMQSPRAWRGTLDTGPRRPAWLLPLLSEAAAGTLLPGLGPGCVFGNPRPASWEPLTK